MSVWDWILGRTPAAPQSIPFDTYDAAQRVLPSPYEPFMGSTSIPVADPGYPLSWGYRGDIERIWTSQPNVRKVVDFIARNVATIPLHTHERLADNDRRRVTEHPIADLMSLPRAGVSPFRFWHAIMSDALLYDQWAAIFVPGSDGAAELVQVPSWRLRFTTDALRQVTGAQFWVGDQPRHVREDTENGWRALDLDMLVFDHGYAPSGAGLSPMVTLKDILDESAEAVAYRRQVWANGGRSPQYMYRPPGAPPWSNEARERFKTSFRAAYTGRGPDAGGMPLLEDGLEIKSSDAFKPQDTEDLEGRRLTAIEVSGAYHIAPELVGAQQGNYSNVREFRQMLYRDSLGPYISSLEQTLNAQLVPRMAGGRRLYVEANVESKLRGDFIEQATVKSSATGAPWLTRNEARALENRPPLPGGDDLVTPLNVLIGGQSSPRDSGSQNLAARAPAALPRVKGRPPESHVEQTRRVMSKFFARQASVVRSRLGQKDADWWDQERWDNELGDDLFRLSVMVSEQVAASTLESIGFGPDEYDTDRTLAFLKAVSGRVAGQVNSTTFAAIEAALEDDEDPSAAVANVFEVAETSRAEQAAVTAVTTFAGFATMEAAKQVAGDQVTKTWNTTSGNPRASHAAMDGETVGIDETFSNGAMWPGGVGDVDEDAGCMCSLTINRP